jgi:hypothetical protein
VAICLFVDCHERPRSTNMLSVLKIYSNCGLKSILETRRLFAAARRRRPAFDTKIEDKTMYILHNFKLHMNYMK